MTKADFIRAMAPLAVNYRRELTRPTMRLFWEEFGYLEPSAYAAAVQGHVRAEKFFPTIAELRLRLGLDQRPGLAEGGAVFEALMGRGPAWDPERGDHWTLQAVADRFGLPALAAFMAAGGTRAFCDATVRGTPFLRNAFMAGWKEAGERLPEGLPAWTRLSPAGVGRGLAPASESISRLLPGGAERGDAHEGEDV